MGNRKMKKPVWEIFQDGTADPVEWKDHAPNPRFAIYDPFGGSDPSDQSTLSEDLVLDWETGLVWARNANLVGQHNWLDCNTRCRELEVGGRSGWRLPRVEELSSLIDPGRPDLALPEGHPFINVQYGDGVYAYWTSTNYENPGSSANPSAAAWFVNFWRGAGPHLAGLGNKSIPGHAWPVRGGSGGNSWNW